MSQLDDCIHSYTMICKSIGFDTKEGSFMRCAFSADGFFYMLQQRGIESKMALFAHDGYELYHVATVVGDMVFDWTYRQFVDTAPFPMILTVHEFESLGWFQVHDDPKFVEHCSVPKGFLFDDIEQLLLDTRDREDAVAKD